MTTAAPVLASAPVPPVGTGTVVVEAFGPVGSPVGVGPTGLSVGAGSVGSWDGAGSVGSWVGAGSVGS
ncbi:hypothetical protein ACSL103130_12315 [Actinomyces slackii]